LDTANYFLNNPLILVVGVLVSACFTYLRYASQNISGRLKRYDPGGKLLQPIKTLDVQLANLSYRLNSGRVYSNAINLACYSKIKKDKIFYEDCPHN